MKKIMIALAGVALAMGVNAATVSWKVQGTTDQKTGTWNVYMFIGDVVGAANTALSSKDATAWTAFLGSSLGVLSTARGSLSDKTDGFVGTDPEYMTAVLVNGSVANGSAYQILTAQDIYDYEYSGTTKPTVFQYDVSGNVAYSGTLSTGASDTPEPTSGLLLLFGVAGLALRRKQA